MTWDIYAAELADTSRSTPYARPKRPCIYCGVDTKAVSGVCWRHDDLPALEIDAVVEQLAQEHERAGE